MVPHMYGTYALEEGLTGWTLIEHDTLFGKFSLQFAPEREFKTLLANHVRMQSACSEKKKSERTKKKKADRLIPHRSRNRLPRSDTV